MEIATNNYLRAVLRMHIDKCDPKPQVQMLFGASYCVYDKAFSLSSNYPTGVGEAFLEYMLDNQHSFAL